MTEKELKKMGRAELLELLLEKEKERELLENEVLSLNEKLESKEIMINEAGSIASASLVLNDVFVKAQAAADDYLENIKKLSERQESICLEREKESVSKTDKMLSEAKEQAQGIVDKALKEAERVVQEAGEKARKIKVEADMYAEATIKEADEKAELRWKEFSEKAENLISAHEGLKSFFEGKNIKE